MECIFNDFALMFDNTCRYYKSNTIQYKVSVTSLQIFPLSIIFAVQDAVTLHKVLLQKREQLTKSVQTCALVFC